MRNLRWTGAFTKDMKRLTKRGYDLHNLHSILNALQKGEALPPAARPHRLSGAWTGAWDCHVAGDWVLIYEVTDDEVRLLRTGTHADLFKS